jgi:hypothetical protein
MQFGRNAGMVTVLIGDPAKVKPADEPLIDYYCESLLQFATAIKGE